MTITGIDYLTGESGIPVGELWFVAGDAEAAAACVPSTRDGFPGFAAVFCHKYGAASSNIPPVVLTDESLAVVRSFYDRSDGRIKRVSDDRANKSW